MFALTGPTRRWEPKRNVATGKTLTTFAGHTAQVWAVAFSPDKGTLATGSSDKTVRLWDSVLLKPNTAIRTICQHVNRDLTADERAGYLPDQSVGPVCHTTWPADGQEPASP
ncbi:WD40 repeat domain-containing protein [Streptomyces sp. NPDC059766]|uniref:WD40 repeat domain-containing protein n=1 Tax=Streptomyces sp. NPDC059766 TaxID=3346940 RepID=UPI003662AF7B